jgi:hypothetical protein
MTSASRWQTIVQQVGATENKALLWSLLSEENVFTGLNEQSIQPVITLFETAIHTTVNGYLQNQDAASLAMMQTQTSQSILSELNKDVIKRVIQDVAQYRSSTNSNYNSNTNVNTNSGKPIYKSSDIQEARIRDITSKVKVLENDMNSFLVLKKPPEIDFSDKNVDDDAPIGDNMDQLIRDALASRARELEVIQFDGPPPSVDAIATANTAATAIATTATDSLLATSKKTVSFDIELDSNAVNDAEMEIGNIFNKLKRPAQPLHQQQQQQQQQQQPPQQLVQPTPTVKQEQDYSHKLEELMTAVREMQNVLQSLVVDVQFIKANLFVYDEPVLASE